MPNETEKQTIDTVIAASVAAMLDDGRVQEIIDAKLSEAVGEAVRAAIGYSGNTGKLIKEIVDNAMCNALQSRVLPRYNVKLESALDEVIAQSNLATTTNLLRNFQGLMDPQLEPRSTVPVDALFDTFCKYVASAYDCRGREIDFDDRPTYVPIECHVELEDGGLSPYSRSHRHGVLRFMVDDIDTSSNDEKYLCFDIPIYRWDDWDKEGIWHIHDTPPATFGGLANMNAFEVKVSALAHADCRIDVTDMPNEEYVEPEAEPEPDWS